MKLSGSYQINLEKQKVWEALNDPEILRKSIPGCEDFKKDSETEFTATATNKIGPFNASFTGNIELKEINAPNSYVIEGSGSSPVGFASGSAKVSLEDFEGGTKLNYEVNKVDTKKVDPLTSIAETSLKLRGDEVKTKNIREQILKNSPDENKDFFVVPKVVE